MSVTRINFTSIPVDDQDRAIAYYTSRLGFELQVDAPYAEGWRWIFLRLPDHDTRLTFSRRQHLQVAVDIPCLALVVEDVDETCAGLSAAGTRITAGPDAAPWAAAGVRYATILDSEGNVVLLESGGG